MDPQNSDPYCILCRDLKVLLRQIFNSLSQVSVATGSSLSRPAPYAHSWIQSRQSFLGHDSIFYSAYSFYRDRVSFFATNLSLAL